MMKKLTPFILSLSIIFLTLLVGCEKVNRTTVISGRVTDYITKQPHAGVYIKLSDDAQYPCHTRGASVTAFDTTDKDGKFGVMATFNNNCKGDAYFHINFKPTDTLSYSSGYGVDVVEGEERYIDLKISYAGNYYLSLLKSNTITPYDSMKFSITADSVGNLFYSFLADTVYMDSKVRETNILYLREYDWYKQKNYDPYTGYPEPTSEIGRLISRGQIISHLPIRKTYAYKRNGKWEYKQDKKISIPKQTVLDTLFY